MTAYMTPKELCQRYRNTVTERTLANWRSQGEGPQFVKVGGRVLYSEKAIIEWESKRTRKSDK